MKVVKPCILLSLLLLVPSVGAAEWKPAAAALMTRWAKEVSPQNALPEYPRPQMVRSQWLNLNGLWQLDLKADEGDAAPVGKDLPQTILVPFPVESALSGVMQPADRVWYRRTFEVPEGWKGNRILLHFGAVDWEATVYVNGKELGTHRGGYDAFSFDITDALTSDPKQELLVKVWDPTDQGDQPRGKQVKNPKGIWYTPTTGIWQTVWLEPASAARIDQLTLAPDVDASCLRVTATGVGATAAHAIEVVARAGDVEVAKTTGPVGEPVELKIPKESLKLWSPDQPFLYDLTVTLTAGGKAVDTVASYFGMRKIDLAADAQGRLRMRLNGEFVFQMGPLDQGFWPDGLYTAPTDEALRYDIEVTKQLGFNMTRKHVKIEPARWYYWCDKLGLVVWQDMPSSNNKTPESKEQFRRELTRLVEGFGNHPSVIMWVVFNEGWGQHDTERYVELVKQLDPSRLVNNASGWTDMKVGDVIDMHRYPGPGAPEPESRRASVLGEFGGLGLGVDGHTWTQKAWGYRGMASAQELTQRYVSLMRGVWGLSESAGLCAAVYTQITDVETECNGLLTYDRVLIKVDLPRIAAANRGQIPRLIEVVPTSQAKGQPWRFTFQKPADGWFQPDYDDSGWKAGPGGFGVKKTPGAVVRTEWKTPEIWLRRSIDLPPVKPEELSLVVHHDEDVEIYFNGVLAAKAKGYTVDYEELPIRPEALAALRPGKNVLAVYCKQTVGGQYVDAGLMRVADGK